MQEIMKVWIPENPLSLNESLLAMRAYVPYHQLYAISMCFAIANNNVERIPSPDITYQRAQEFNLTQELVKITANCLNSSLSSAINECTTNNKIFSPQNWLKTKKCCADINSSIGNCLFFLSSFSEGEILKQKLDQALKLPQEYFEYRWAAD
jgi:hypothetical protein